MSHLEKNIQKLLDRQREAMYSEAEKAGVTILDFQEVVPEGDKTKGAFTGALKSVLGGTTKVAVYQTYKLQRGRLSATLYQPYEGVATWPGEFHALIDGCFPSPLQLRKKFLWGITWKGDKEFTRLLSQQTAVMQSAKALKWKWAAGLAQIEHEWALQILSVGNGQSHVVHPGARYGGFTTYVVGMNAFFSMLEALAASPLLEQGEVPSHTPFDGTQFGDIFFSELSQ